MSDEAILSVLKDIRNWTRAASFGAVKKLLEEALPDPKSRAAYQMMDGRASRDEICAKCKLSPQTILTIGQRCVAMGLMEAREDKKRIRLFDLADFGMIDTPQMPGEQAKK